MGTKHTPLPWKCSDSDVYNGRFGHGTRIALGCEPADAEFIAKACNCHDDLLKVCEAIESHWANGNFSRKPKLWNSLKDAIKKAKGA